MINLGKPKSTFNLRATLTKLCVIVTLAFTLGGCKAPKDVTYFSALESDTNIDLPSMRELTVMPGDRVSLVVVSKDAQLSSLFNLPVVAQRVNTPAVTTTSNRSNTEVASYVVDAYGNIQFPVLGTVHLGGLRRSEVAEHIQNELISRNLIKDPVVIVDFLNRGVTVLGEVKDPGRIVFDRDQYTLLDAIAEAGDLNIQGKRTDVLVLRRENGQEKSYRVDLTDAEATFKSPVFYLQQGDVVYVSPNDMRKRQTTANGSNAYTPSFWISIASMCVTLAVLIWK